jgi:hypothetical protein
MQPEDRAYLVRLTAANTGLAQPDAERRVDEVAARAKENIARARRSAVILAFTAGAAALLGAAASWFAACAGGRVRDGEVLASRAVRLGKASKANLNTVRRRGRVPKTHVACHLGEKTRARRTPYSSASIQTISRCHRSQWMTLG